MKNMENNFIYDVFVIGNGIAAKHFLFELSNKISQTIDKQYQISVGQIFDNKITPACSDNASVTISLNGIREEISQLGNELRDGYFSFVEFVEKYSPDGVFKTNRIVSATNEVDKDKLYRRYTFYQNIELKNLSYNYLKGPLIGTEYSAYMIDVSSYLAWFDRQLNHSWLHRFEGFVNDIRFENGIYEIELKDKTIFKTKKLVLAMGAYSKIYSNFFDLFSKLKELSIYNENNNQIKVGSYLYKEVKWGMGPLYLVIDGNKLMYYKVGYKEYLRLATVTTLGTEVACDHAQFQKIYNLYKEKTNLDIGTYESFSYGYGLRHKRPKRLLISSELDQNNLPGLYMINGFYKNGFTLSFVATKKIINYF